MHRTFHVRRASFFAPYLYVNCARAPCALMGQPLKVFSILTFCHICGHFNSQVVFRTQPILTTHHLPKYHIFLPIRYHLQ